MGIRISTWNVNSIRIRLDGLQRLVETARPDVVCLQETKVADHLFPADAIRELGFEHQLLHGAKGYNGVAILSRRPFIETGTRAWCGREDCRHALASIDAGEGIGPIEIHSLYVPAGGDIPDPETNDKFAHKLQFLEEMRDWSMSLSPDTPAVLVGDLNVAPLESDVWSHRQLRNVISHTEPEIERLNRAMKDGRWIDAVRHLIPPPERLYTWWSYRARDWSASDRGRRLDHIWARPALEPRFDDVQVLREARGWPKPSDHVPVTLSLKD